MAVSASNSNAYLAQVDPYVPSTAYDASIPQVEPTPAPAAAPSTQAAPVEQPGKDEVGWMFVEQYYTTLNKSPEKLHLFYNKKSVFTWGTEGEVVQSHAGRNDIAERIKQEGFNDCKVRVTNVDSQASLQNSIMIQVIGEMSNDGNPNRKFAQTFFLAEQPHGYFVLNDIFRFLNDEEEELVEEGEEAVEEVAEEEPVAAEPEPIHELAEQEPEVPVEEPKVEETPVEEPKAEEPEAATNGVTNGAPVEEPVAEAEPEVAPVEEAKVEEAPAAEEPKVEEPVAAEPEVVAEPEPTPTPAPAPVQEKPAPPPAPAVPAAPPKPKTWANLVAGGANKPAPAVPVVAAAPTVAPTPAVAPAAAATVPAATPAAASPAPATPSTPTGSGGWQSVGDNTRRHQAKASAASGEITLAFIRNVGEKVDADLLEKKLAKFGTLKQFEVSKQRNCAFVEFETAAAFKAAQAANPHQIGDQTINVEERRPRQSGQSGGYQRGAYTPRAGRGEGRGGFQPRGDGGKFYEGNRPAGRGGAGQGGRGGFGGRGGRGGQSQA